MQKVNRFLRIFLFLAFFPMIQVYATEGRQYRMSEKSTIFHQLSATFRASFSSSSIILQPQCEFSTTVPFGLQLAPVDSANRRHLFRDVKNYFVMYLKDGWHLLLTPARLNRQSTRWLGGVLLVGGLIYAYDENIFAGLHKHKENSTY